MASDAYARHAQRGREFERSHTHIVAHGIGVEAGFDESVRAHRAAAERGGIEGVKAVTVDDPRIRSSLQKQIDGMDVLLESKGQPRAEGGGQSAHGSTEKGVEGVGD